VGSSTAWGLLASACTHKQGHSRASARTPRLGLLSSPMSARFSPRPGGAEAHKHNTMALISCVFTRLGTDCAAPHLLLRVRLGLATLPAVGGPHVGNYKLEGVVNPLDLLMQHGDV